MRSVYYFCIGCYMCLRDWRLLVEPFHFLSKVTMNVKPINYRAIIMNTDAKQVLIPTGEADGDIVLLPV